MSVLMAAAYCGARIERVEGTIKEGLTRTEGAQVISGLSVIISWVTKHERIMQTVEEVDMGDQDGPLYAGRAPGSLVDTTLTAMGRSMLIGRVLKDLYGEYVKQPF